MKNKNLDIKTGNKKFRYKNFILGKIVRYPSTVRSQLAHVINVAILGGIHFDSRKMNLSILGEFKDKVNGSDVEFFLHPLVEDGICYSMSYFTTNSRVCLFDIPGETGERDAALTKSKKSEKKKIFFTHLNVLIHKNA